MLDLWHTQEFPLYRIERDVLAFVLFISFSMLYFIWSLIHLSGSNHKGSNFSNWNFVLWWQMLWYIPPSLNKSPRRCFHRIQCFYFPSRHSWGKKSLALLSGDERGVFIMDLSDKLVTTSGEKESHDFPFSSPASLQCGQILHSLILSREGLVLTLSILPCPQGWISWSIPVDELMMRRMSVLHQNSGGIGKSIPLPLRFPSGFALGKSFGSQEISWASGMDFPIPPSSWWRTDPSKEYFKSDIWVFCTF